MQVNSAPALSPLNQNLVNAYKNNKKSAPIKAEVPENTPKVQEFKNGLSDKIQKLPKNKKLLTSLAIVGAIIAGIFLYYRGKAKNPEIIAKSALDKALNVQNNSKSILNEAQDMKKTALDAYNEVMEIIRNAVKTNFANFKTEKGTTVEFNKTGNIPSVIQEIDEKGKVLRKTTLSKTKGNNFFIKSILDYKTKTCNNYEFLQDGSLDKILIDYKKINKSTEKFAKGIIFKDKDTIFCEFAEMKNGIITKAKKLYNFYDNNLKSFCEDIDTKKGKKTCFEFQDAKIQTYSMKDNKTFSTYSFCENEGKYKICANHIFDING